MAIYQKLENAPINEAVLDIRCQARVELQALESLHEKIRSEFPNVKKRMQVQSNFNLGANTASNSFNVDGFQFHSSDSKEVVQFRLDGFTYSRLKPYTSWANVCKRSKDLSKIFFDGANPHHISRIAVRYINIIDLPKASPSEYFNLQFKVPDTLSGKLVSIEQYRVSLVGKFEDEISAMINLSSLNSEDPFMHRYLLDIDVFIDHTNFKPYDSERMWLAFDKIASIKNEIFFGCITETTRSFCK